MIIPRELLAALLPACDTNGDTRYFLQAINVEPSGRLSATDGHVLLTGRVLSPTPDDEFPIVAGAPFHGTPSKAVMVPADVAAKLIKATPSKTRTLPILGCVQLSQNGSPETATLAATDLQTPMIATIKNDDGRTFPDVDRVLKIQEGAEFVELTLGVPVLEALIKSAKALKNGSNGRAPSITFQVPSNGFGRQRDNTDACGAADATDLGPVIGPVPVSFSNGDITIDGVVMPMRK